MKKLALALLAPAAMLLTGCLLTPGKFTSELQLMADGSFTYRYDGEIQMLALSKLAEMADRDEPEEFVAACYDDDFEERECTTEESTAQRAEWDAGAAERKATKAREAEQMRAFLGGIDPTNPEAAQELAARLERQKGWTSVVYRGDGLFDVDFEIAGMLSHDFVFPTVEGMPNANSFLAVTLREGRQIRVNAPGFAVQAEGNPLLGAMPLAGLAALSEADESNELPRIASPEGTFTLVTNGKILANNTDEGPVPHASGQALVWQVNARSKQAPTALIALQ